MKRSKWIASLILCFMLTTIALSGCRFFSSTKLKAPVLSLNEEDSTISWDANYNAAEYEVYMNESYVATIESDSDKTQYSYDYSEDVGDFGEFRFQVKSIASGKYADSDLSEAVVVTIGSASSYLDKNNPITKTSYNSNYAPKNIKRSGNMLSWSAPNITTNMSGYLVSIYTNSLGVIDYHVDENSIEISDSMKSGNDVLAIKVCAIVGGAAYEADDLFYYNPLDDNKYGVYTDKIYIFDGEVYDYYIENWTELQNLYYYAFVYRIEDLTFMVSNSFYEEYKDSYFDTSSLNNYKADDYIVGHAYYETYGFNDVPGLTTASGLGSTNEKCFRLTCKFAVKEPSITDVGASTPTYSQDNRYEPYYNTVKYERRADNYNNFVSDKWFLSTEVSTSEELFWAVSTHVTPIIEDKTSRAYLIYEKAKDVLRDIICDEMTDYEKVLSIFDYIMTSTTYDYNAFNQASNVNPMEFSCYYLEAVFLNEQKISVCDGYSKAFTLLCNMEGINAVRVVGTAGVTSQGGHAWNKVEIDDNWYVVDLTWTELQGNSEGLTKYRKKLTYGASGPVYYWEAYTEIDEEESCHAYFLVSDEDIADTHHEFDNRFLYSLIDSPNSYDYYEQSYLKVNNVDYSRVVTEEGQLTVLLDDCLKNNYKGIEVVISVDLFSQAKYDGSVVEILKAARYSFCSMSYFIYTVESDIQYVASGVSINNETLYYYKGMGYAAFEYNSDGDVGIFMIISPTVSLTTTERFNDYINFVVQNNIQKQEKVNISKDKIYEWIASITDVTKLNGYYAGMTANQKSELLISYIDGLTDSQRLDKVESYFNQVFLNSGQNITTQITRTANDKTELTSTQDESGNWVEKTLTTGEFTLEFNY